MYQQGSNDVADSHLNTGDDDDSEGSEFSAEDLEFVEDDGNNDRGSDHDDDADDADAELTDEQRQPLEVTRDDSVATLAGHSSSVFCVAASPDGRMLASGGEDDRVLVWRIAAAAQSGESDDGQVKANLVGDCGGFTDSVVFTAFNK